MIAVDPTSQIILRRNIRDPDFNRAIFRTYACESILSKGQCMYNPKMFYKITYDEEKELNTVELDEATDCPIIDESPNYKVYQDSLTKIQQHILIQTINKKLRELDKKELEYYTIKNKHTILLEGIQFDHFYDVNDTCELEMKSKTKDGSNSCYKDLCQTIINEIVYFIDRTEGKSKQLIIGDFNIKENSFAIDEEYSRIGGWKFLESIYEIRHNKRKIKDLFPENTSNPTQTNEDQMEEEEVENGFLQSDYYEK